MSSDLKEKLNKGFHAGLMKGNLLENDDEIEAELGTTSVSMFFDNLRKEVSEYYLG